MSDIKVCNPEFTPEQQRAALVWFASLKGIAPESVELVDLEFPGGAFIGIKYTRDVGSPALYIPAYYSIFRRAVHPYNGAKQKRKQLRVAFRCDGETWYLSHHGPTHRDGQPMIAIPDGMRDIYPFGPVVGLMRWEGAEAIDRYETKPYDLVPLAITDTAPKG